MNLILFEPEEIEPENIIFLQSDDPRSFHLKKILKAEKGSSFRAGIINGPRGSASICSISEAGVEISFSPEAETGALYPITLILGLSRPPTIKKILKEATALGAGRFILCGTENGERSYIQSSALKPGKIRELLIEGAQQAYCTMLPEVEICGHISSAVKMINSPNQAEALLALDNCEPEISLARFWQNEKTTEITSAVLAVGSERGWNDNERRRLREAGFRLCGIGSRVLRTETASITGTAVCLAGLGFI